MMNDQTGTSAQHEIVPPGYELAQAALIRLHEARVDASEAKDRDQQRTGLRMLVTDALRAGTLVVFIRTRDGDLVPVPTDAWRVYPADAGRSHTNIDRLHKTGLRHEDPLILSHETFTARGVALFDQHNWAGFLTYAGRWPPYEIPASVRLLLKFCEHRKAISEGLPLQKADAIDWFRQNWPAELEDQWPRQDRLSKAYRNKDNCPAFVSEFAHVVLDPSERKGGVIPHNIHKAISDRRRRMARGEMTGAEFDDGLAIISDDT